MYKRNSKHQGNLVVSSKSTKIKILGNTHPEKIKSIKKEEWQAVKDVEVAELPREEKAILVKGVLQIYFSFNLFQKINQFPLVL